MRSRVFSSLLLVLLLVSSFAPVFDVQAQTTPERKARDLLQVLTPEERVGQLFLVTFKGTDAGTNSQIYELITKYHVGGVVLTADNDNFVDAPDTVLSARSLISDLQQAEWESSTRPVDLNYPHNYVPLFVGMVQEGGGYPNDQILSGLTTLPSQMAIGATWKPALAEEAGGVMGRELSALGVNLYMGLSLDVLTSPNASVGADLSTRVFGGDPYWVGEMGRAFLRGMQSSSGGRMAVVATHFPGGGETDRPPEQEVSTVRKVLEELRQIELAPFFGVTNAAPETVGAVDGLLVSHIRYQGFQGNIRATTRPVSFDQQALSLILELPQFAIWRQSGGVLVTDDLGTTAVRRFYDPGNQDFSARLVARDAFLAGNDLLYMGNIVSKDLPDNYTSVVRTLEFFSQKYREDSAFAQLVDAAVLRILMLKYRLYPSFTIGLVQPPVSRLEQLNQSQELLFSIARQSATLISPASSSLSSVLPDPPVQREYIIFFTDTGSSKQCSTCVDTPILDENALERAVLRLYGPSTGGLVTPSHMSSYSLNELFQHLDGRVPQPDLDNELRRAEWVVFSTLDLSESRSETSLLRNFLAEKQDLLLNKRVLLFSFSAPYYLDSTDISKLTAYYGMYSASTPFVDMAARLLFQELSPLGSSPVSIAGVDYDLITAMSPNPRQVISLLLDIPPLAAPTNTIVEAPTPAPLFRVTDTISLQTGIILDRNSHPVPDGTVVRFILTRPENGLSQQTEAVTVQGVARTSFRLDQPGTIEIRVVSEPALVSDVIQLNVTNEGAPVIIITPTTIATPQPSPSPTPTEVVTEAPEAPEPITLENGYPNLMGWALVILAVLAGSSFAYWMGGQFAGARWGIRWALVVLVGGLFAYNYLVFDLPGASEWLADRGLPAFIQAVVFGQMVGLVGGWIWQLVSQRSNQAE